MLDRLIRGRAWIAVIGVMLMGLVFLQVSMLRLNTGIGRDVSRAAELERSNQQLRTSVATLSGGDRIEEAAGALGMVMPAAGQVRYLHAGSASPKEAVSNLTAPAPVQQLPADPAAATSAVPVQQQAAPVQQQAAPVQQQAAPVQQQAAPVQQQAAAVQQQAAPVQQQAAPAQQQATPTATTAATGGVAAG